MLSGETISVLRPRITGIDDYHQPVRAWDEEHVADVLVNPAAPHDDADSMTPDATGADMTLYLPRTYSGDLTGCKAIVRGREYRILGTPTPLDGGIRPTRWHMEAHIARDDGR